MKPRTFPARMVRITGDLNYTLDLDLGFDLTKRVRVTLEIGNLEPDEWTILSRKRDAVRVFVGFWFMDAQRNGDWPLEATTELRVNGAYIAQVQDARTGENLSDAIQAYVRGLG